MSYTAQDLLNSFSKERKLFLVTGLYRYQNPNFFHYARGFLTLTLGIFQFSAMLAEILLPEFFGDLFKMSQTLLFFFMYFIYMCKMINFMLHRTNMAEIEDILSKTIFFQHQYIDILKNSIRATGNVGNLLRVLAGGSVVLYLILPFLDTSKKTLPLPGWYPYNVTQFYYPTLFLQLLAVSQACSINVSLDITTWILVAIATGEFGILKKNLEDIDYGHNVVRMKLKQCVQHHQNIIELVQKIQVTFSYGLFIMMLSYVGIICFTGFMMVLVPFLSAQFNFFFIYLMSVSFDLAFFCWYGNLLMVTSDEISTSLYMSNWYESDVATRKIIVIFLENTKKPISLSAGGLFILNLSTFSAVVRTGYSYIAMLKRLYE